MKRTPVKRKTPLRPRNPERREREFRRTYHSLERVRFVKNLPCCVPGCEAAPSENAHVGIEGIGRKSHYTRIVPLCAVHHRTGPDALHRIGRERFEALHGLSLHDEAEWTQSRWEAWGIPALFDGEGE